MKMPKILLKIILFLGLGFSAQAGTGYSNDDENPRGDEIMQKVFDRFYLNYEMSRTHKEGFYQESMSDGNKLVYIAEAIVDIYIPHNLNEKDYAYVAPIRSRRKDYQKVDEEYLLLGNASDMARSSIWRPDSFLGEKLRNSYKFDFLKDSVIRGMDVFVIEFDPADKSGEHNGKVYVDKEHYAIVRVVYEPFVKNSKWWKHITWTEDFIFRNGAFELESVTFHGESGDVDFQYDATLVMQQIETVVDLPPGKEFLPTRTSLFEQADSDPNPLFWEGYVDIKDQTKPKDLIAFEGLN